MLRSVSDPFLPSLRGSDQSRRRLEASHTRERLRRHGDIAGPSDEDAMPSWLAEAAEDAFTPPGAGGGGLKTAEEPFDAAEWVVKLQAAIVEVVKNFDKPITYSEIGAKLGLNDTCFSKSNFKDTLMKGVVEEMVYKNLLKWSGTVRGAAYPPAYVDLP